jgi:Ser/Thr protein kinase RdoA (MazF antagonist)
VTVLTKTHVLPADLPDLLVEHGVAAAGSTRTVSSEADRTFLIPTRDGGVVVKESPRGSSSCRMQAALLRHVAVVAPSLPVPRILTRSGSAMPVRETARGEAVVMTLVPGVALEDARLDGALVDRIADLQIALQEALRTVEAGAAHVPERNDWSHDAVAALAPAVDELAEPRHRAVLHAILAEHAAKVAPALRDLPRQVIHGDFNLSNVLVQGDAVSGVIDFGDAVLAPRVWDVAVTVCYLGLAAGALDHPLTLRYLRRTALTATERALLPVLVRCRLALVVLQGRLTARAPEKAAYALRYDHLALTILDGILARRSARTEHP